MRLDRQFHRRFCRQSRRVVLLYDTLQREDFDPAGTYADFLARALSDGQTWPVDLQARYLELTATA
jgi:hypothetical protein